MDDPKSKILPNGDIVTPYAIYKKEQKMAVTLIVRNNSELTQKLISIIKEEYRELITINTVINGFGDELTKVHMKI